MLFGQGDPCACSEEFLLSWEGELGWHWRNEPGSALCWMLKVSPALTKMFSWLNVTCRERRGFWINASR